jgi:sigma-B regulation protein RsbU (phosphoserine phosphatase)
MKILVVDDDAIDRTVISSLLRNLGHQVVEAGDGRSALEILRQQKIPIVLSDWMMPEWSGIDLCRSIRESAFDQYIYVILCTSRGERADLIEGMDAGADDFVVKPASFEELRVRVRAGQRIVELEQRLADRSNQLEQSNRRLQRAFEHIESDVRAAAWMQENLLPSPTVNALGVTCNWRYRPSGYLAGDIFNFFAVDETQVGFYLLDVAGHGVPAAMCSVGLSMLLRPDGTRGGLLKRYDALSDTLKVAEPRDVIADLNERFQTAEDRHFTISYGLVDSQKSLLRLAQAGNPNPVLIHSQGMVRTLTNGGMPVGLWPDIHIDYVEVPFQPGDRLVLYSDGITECTNNHNEEFGDERLVDYLASAAGNSMDLLLNGLEQRLEHWRGSTEFYDDVSLLAVELTGQEKQ